MQRKGKAENGSSGEKPYDIGERTFLFGVQVVRLDGHRTQRGKGDPLLAAHHP